MGADNELIAEFMGYVKWEHTEYDKWYSQHPQDHLKSVFGVPARDMRYHESWDWLMPVLEKIGVLYSDAFPSSEKCIELMLANQDPVDNHYIDIVSTSIVTPITEAYNAVVKFIKWYNSQLAAQQQTSDSARNSENL